jgi:hypothetical protein
MKAWITIASMLFITAVHSQNEFAATAFYNEFKKIYADAQNGFILNKGVKKNAQYAELADEFKIKINLMLADSGKVVVPKNGNRPYALYYFEPAKSRLKVDQRGLNLREAIGTAYAKQLFARTETKVIDEKVYADTYFYDKEDITDKKAALFRISIFPNDTKYYLTLEIRGQAAENAATVPAQ